MRNLRLNHWILASQIILLVLVIALAWQGVSAARTQDRMVRELMSDYAQLIVENAERGFNSALGYRTFYALVDGLQSQPELFPMDRAWQTTAFTESTPLPLEPDEILAVVIRTKNPEESRILWLETSLENTINPLKILYKLDKIIYQEEPNPDKSCFFSRPYKRDWEIPEIRLASSRFPFTRFKSIFK